VTLMSEGAKNRRRTLSEVKVRIELPPVSELPIAQYANFASATTSQHETVITFAQFTAPSDEVEVNDLQKTALMRAKPVARVAIPHSLLVPLIDVLTRQQDALHGDESASASEEED